MRKKSKLYVTALVVSIVFIGYTTYSNFIYDPEASRFLSHKTGLKHVSLWLSIRNVHILAACAAMIAGLVNFSKRIRQSRPKLHRIIGYGYVAAVAIVDLTSGYMAPSSTGGKASSIAFNFINLIWLIITVIAVVKIRKKQVIQHRKWMIRSYVFVFTNMFIHLITAAFHQGFGLDYTISYTISVYCSIVLLLALAEVVIRTRPAVGGSQPL
ncbi:DUF2306 domain-containing protein [Paenibacillus glycanilyticus]|uniref:DUF2306 domain-containing protein n=1 Tax=Paenibacillus glycanilyticus TaxID=126569 RepID=A0ABQ6GD54_9BACL|nr:DUF2306 domain-containing protein [Paenibacillus glycanilyticus]GLX68803.1 hypothetical protein MU1_31480 [Paenibacillus glycanilyticus]